MLQTLICHAISFISGIVFLLWIPAFLRNLALILLSLGSMTFLCIVLARILDRLLPRRKVSPLNKAIFITGCDSGFGHLLAKRLDSRGFKVFAGCLMPDGPGAQKLRTATSSNLTIVGVDVTSDESVQNARRSVEEKLQNDELWSVVSNAGIIARGEVEWTLLETYKKLFEVNTFGAVRVTQAFLPLLRKFKGRLVTTTSFGGRHTFTTIVPYCMSKHATNSFCDGLRLEMEKWDVKVITVEPFSFKTPMTDVEYIMKNVDDAWSKAPAEVKESYGDDYVEKYKKAAYDFNYLAVSSNTSRVIDCLEEAATAVSPHFFYNPGDLKSVVGFWFLKRAPQTLMNYIKSNFICFDGKIAKDMKDRIKKKI